MSCNYYHAYLVKYFIVFLSCIVCTPCWVATHNKSGRLTIVVALKHKQFLSLYDFLKTHAKSFDPRYAGSLATSGKAKDKHKNLHITLASAELGYEKACKKALHAIEGYFSHAIHINFDPKKIELDDEHHVKLYLKKDKNYNQLLKLQSKVVKTLKKEKVKDIHYRAPDHVTIGFAKKLYKHAFPSKIGAGKISYARLYHWKGHGTQAHEPREEFYPKSEVLIWKKSKKDHKKVTASKKNKNIKKNDKKHKKK